MKDLLLKRFDLQRFAEGREDPKTIDIQIAGQDETKEEEVKNYSQEELNKAIEEAVEEAKKGLLTKDKVNEIVEARVAEEKKRAKMTAEERAKEERAKTKKELADTKEELRLLRLSNGTSELLDKEKLPQIFKGYLMKDDLETTKANIESFNKVFQEEIKKAVEEKLKGKAPSVGNKEDHKADVWEIAAKSIK